MKPLGDNTSLSDSDLIDWGAEDKFQTAIGVGECAGVIIDLVQTLFYEAEEKLTWSAETFDSEQYGDSIYYSYASFIHAAKGLLLDKQVHVNTHHSLIADFDKHFVETGLIDLKSSFKDLALQINKNEPGKEFAQSYFEEARSFVENIKQYRESDILNLKELIK